MTTPTLEQKIEAEATLKSCEYMEEYSYVPYMIVAKDSYFDGFKSAALPLHKEIDVLRCSLKLSLESIELLIKAVEVEIPPETTTFIDMYRKRFKLDEVQS